MTLTTPFVRSLRRSGCPRGARDSASRGRPRFALIGDILLYEKENPFSGRRRVNKGNESTLLLFGSPATPKGPWLCVTGSRRFCLFVRISVPVFYKISRKNATPFSTFLTLQLHTDKRDCYFSPSFSIPRRCILASSSRSLLRAVSTAERKYW